MAKTAPVQNRKLLGRSPTHTTSTLTVTSRAHDPFPADCVRAAKAATFPRGPETPGWPDRSDRSRDPLLSGGEVKPDPLEPDDGGNGV